MQDLEKIKQSVNPEEIVEDKEELPKKEVAPVDIETQAEDLESWALKEAEDFKNETKDGIIKIENSVNLPQQDIKEIKKETNIVEDLDEINKEVDQITKFDYIKDKVKKFLKIATVAVAFGALPHESNIKLKDYSFEKNFNDAFDNAKNSGDQEFIWQGEKHTTLKENAVGVPIKIRDDFVPNSMSKIGLKAARLEAYMAVDDLNDKKDPYGDLFDLYRYYFGQPLKSDILSISKYKPENSTDTNARYIAISDQNFINDVLKEYNELKTPLKIGESAHVSGYSRFKIVKNNTTSSIGNFKIGRGVDEEGEYISYYDVFKELSGSVENGTETKDRFIGAKAYEIYDRIHVQDSDDGKKKLK